MALHWMKWCRLCAREDTEDTYVNVFLKNEGLYNLANTITKYFSVNMNQFDDWPKTICTSCHQLIANIIAFSHRASKVQAFFEELLISKREPDTDQLKLQHGLCDLDDMEVDVCPLAETLASNPKMIPEMSEPMVDFDELGYIDNVVVSPTSIRSESSDETEYDAESDSLVSSTHDQSTISTTSDDSESESDKNSINSIQLNSMEKNPKKEDPADKIEFTCGNDCDKSIVQNLSCRKPNEADHAMNPPEFPCTECSKTFTTDKSLKSHQISHQPLEGKQRIPCPHCEKKFTTQSMVTHIRSKHIGEKAFICDKCGKAYKSPGSLRDHIQMIHSEEEPFKCSKCEKRFKTKTRLKYHVETHNETRYICTMCGLQLNTYRTLLMHMVVHSDQRQYKCDYCETKFKRTKALKNHLILHTGLRPYKCTFCEKTFAAGSSCRTHKKIAHPKELAAMEASGTSSQNKVPDWDQLRAVASTKDIMVRSRIQGMN